VSQTVDQSSISQEARRSADRAEQGGFGMLELLKFGSQQMLKAAIKEKITAYLGRERHERIGKTFRGERNGYRMATVDTPIGQVILSMPQLKVVQRISLKSFFVILLFFSWSWH